VRNHRGEKKSWAGERAGFFSPAPPKKGRFSRRITVDARGEIFEFLKKHDQRSLVDQFELVRAESDARRE